MAKLATERDPGLDWKLLEEMGRDDWEPRPTRISLELDHLGMCHDLSAPLYLQMSNGKYDECAVLPLQPVEEWRAAHRTARKRADRAEARGYRFCAIHRHRRADEIQRINLSAPERQGRPMSEGYHQRPTETPLPAYPCERHAVRTYGVEDRDGVLVAYVYLYRAGHLALVSQILGHAKHLANEVMYLLVQGTLRMEHRIDPDGFLVYNRWDSGTEGLRFFKQRLGFGPVQVEWLP